MNYAISFLINNVGLIVSIIITVLATVLGIICGGIITYYVSKSYYEKAGKELLTEATKLSNYSRMILQGLEQAGIIKLVYVGTDISGINFKLKINDAIQRTSSDNVELGPDNPKK